MPESPAVWLNAPVKVTAVNVTGLQSTLESTIEPLLAPIVSTDPGPISETLSITQQVCQTLERLGIFSSISISVESDSKSSSSTDASSQPTLSNPAPIQVTIDVKEATKYKASAQTGVRGSEGFMDFSGTLRNTLGGAETLEATLSYGLDSTQVSPGSTPAAPSGFLFSTLFKKPIQGNPDSLFYFSGFKQVRGRQRYLGHDEEILGLFGKWQRLNGFLGDHELTYEAQWRHNLNLHLDAPWSLRQDAGHSLKSSISHSLTFEGRDSPIFPTRGYLVRTLEEFAGLGGDVNHLKTEIEGQHLLPLGSFQLSTTLKSGLLFPLSTKSHPFGRSRINDKFFLGGPLSIRGFEPFGLGPKDKGFSLGGDAYWAAGLSLFTPLPFLCDKTFKGHFFANAGHLIGVDRGLGLIVNFSFLRVECNYTVPIQRHDSDVVKPGIQLGVGVSFM